MNSLIAFFAQHPLIWTAVVMGLQNVFSSVVYSLPEPPPMSSLGYQFLYKFANKLAGNYKLNGNRS